METDRELPSAHTTLLVDREQAGDGWSRQLRESRSCQYGLRPQIRSERKAGTDMSWQLEEKRADAND